MHNQRKEGPPLEDTKRFYRRLRFLLMVFLLTLFSFVGLLYQAQVVNYEDYLIKSTTRVARQEEIGRASCRERV